MDDKIPIIIKPKEKKPRHALRIVLWVLIIFLIVLNIGLISFYVLGQKYFTDFAQSARRAALNSNQWGVMADIGLPAQDVAGEEIPGIRRYPESVRTYYQNNGNLIIAEYQVAADKSVVGDYFKAYLAQNDWVLGQISTETAIFAKENHKITIKFSQNLQITTYHMEYE